MHRYTQRSWLEHFWGWLKGWVVLWYSDTHHVVFTQQQNPIMVKFFLILKSLSVVLPPWHSSSFLLHRIHRMKIRHPKSAAALITSKVSGFTASETSKTAMAQFGEKRRPVSIQMGPVEIVGFSPWKIVIFPLKMVIFPWKMVIFHSYVSLFTRG